MKKRPAREDKVQKVTDYRSMKCFNCCQSPCNKSHRQRQHKTFQELCFVVLTATCLYVRRWYYQFTPLQLSVFLQQLHRHHQLQAAIPAEHLAQCISPVQPAWTKRSSRRVRICSLLHETKHQVKHKIQSWRRLFPPHFWFSWPAPKLWADRFKRHNQIPADKEVWLSERPILNYFHGLPPPICFLVHAFCSALGSPDLVGLGRGGVIGKQWQAPQLTETWSLQRHFWPNIFNLPGNSQFNSRFNLADWGIHLFDSLSESLQSQTLKMIQGRDNAVSVLAKPLQLLIIQIYFWIPEQCRKQQ